MIINLADFHAKYGAGRPPLVGAFKDVNVNPDIEIPVLTALVDYIKAKRCLEIGCNTGATSAAILSGNETIQEYIGVDLPVIWFTKETAGSCALADSRFRLMQLENGSKDLHVGDIEPVDFIYVDGNHEYAWVGYDSQLALSLLNPAGGIIAWHDYNHPGNPGVKQYVHELNDKNFIADNKEPRIIWVQGTTICFQYFENKQITAAPIAAQEEINETTKPRKRSRKATEAIPSLESSPA